MPAPTRDILDALAAAERSQDASTVIAIYGDYLTALLARLQAAERAVRGTLEDPTPEAVLERLTTRFTGVLAALQDEQGDPETIEAFEAGVAQFSVLQLLILHYRGVQSGESAYAIDDAVRSTYDWFCWETEQRAFDDAVPAGKIARLLFTAPLRHADDFFRLELEDLQEELAVIAAPDIWSD